MTDPLPSPPLPWRVELPGGAIDQAQDAVRLRTLPERAGVLVFEDADGATITLLVTANLRRLARTRLASRDSDLGPSRRIDYRAITRVVGAAAVGSAFEADWACLQLARRLMPASYRALLDPWRGWFVHCDPRAAHPRLVKRSTAETTVGRPDDAWIGPYADKQAAQRAIELHQDLFDLCRYHHILVEAPHGAPCVYKEMGRCPAPCDGTVTMDAYRTMVDRALAHAAGRGPALAAEFERSMQEASARLDFEAAAGLRRRLATLAELDKPAFRRARDRRDFRFVAVQEAGNGMHARLFLVLGGRIAPFADLPADAPRAALDEVAAALAGAARTQPIDLSDAGLENVGLVCAHLFARKRDRRGAFLPIPRDAEPTGALLGRAIRRVCSAPGAELAEREV